MFEEGGWFKIGTKVKFWEDGVSLLEKYSPMYIISQQQQYIQQLGVASNGGWE